MYDSEFVYYKPYEIENVLKSVVDRARDKINYRKKQYYNIPCAFDIETTSTQINGHKCAFMYAWVLNINGTSIIGRTWEEFEYCLETIHKKLYTNPERIFVIYVHNLAFEMAFISRRFEWEKVFSVDTRKPIYARDGRGIEFRCSYLLSGYKLAKVADNLQTFKIRKLVGDLDYSKVRHSGTYLSQKEIRYIINDGRIVVAYISEEIERNGNIAKIPLTKTGYVRQACRRNCFSTTHREKWGKVYRARMKQLTLTLDEYDLLKEAFAGGFVHCNPFYTNKNLYNVKSFDFTSSYPTVMVAEKFPMGTGEKVIIKSKQDFEYNIKNYCCVFEVKFTGVHSRVMFDNPISASKCRNIVNCVLNNGRIVSADSFTISLTNVDFNVYKKFYTWKSMTIGKFYRYKADYLPREFVDSILTFYEDKTKLKGVQGMEAEYLHQKENVNSCYGMCVTDILRDLVVMDGQEWIVDRHGYGVQPTTGMDEKEIQKIFAKHPDYKLSLWSLSAANREKEIDKYNKNPQRFLFYAWGIFVTAYARRNILSGVLACGNDYIYSDTDSIKILNADKHANYFKAYNDDISKRLEKACIYHGFSIDRVKPKTIKGKTKPLGIWDDDGDYLIFRTCGAKRYIYLSDDYDDKTGKVTRNLHITIAGSNKEKTAEYLKNTYGKYYAFYKFDNNMCIPAGASGRQSSYYIDFATHGDVTDYQGVKGSFDEKSSVHIEQTEYNMSITDAYIKYFLGVQLTGEEL